MRKLISILVMLGMVFISMAVTKSAYALTTDTFTITVTVNYIEINLRNAGDTADYTTWAIGQLATSGDKTMADTEAVRVKYGTSSQHTDIQSYVSTECSAWLINATPAADKYELVAKGSATTAPSMSGATVLNSGALQTITGATDISADHYLYYKFFAPTSTGVGTLQTITITVGVIVHS